MANHANSNPMTGREKKSLVLDRWRRRVNAHTSAQDSIPYRQMYSSGICLTKDGQYNKTLRFYDINYQLALNDFIAPTSFTIGNGRYFKAGRTIGAASYLQIIAPELSDRLLAEILDMDSDVVVNLHMRSIGAFLKECAIKVKGVILDRG